MKIADIFCAYLYIFKLMLKYETLFCDMRKCFYNITDYLFMYLTSCMNLYIYIDILHYCMYNVS